MNDLQLVEQPCATLEEMAEVRARVEVPLAADEPIAGPADVRRAIELGACDAVNVKLAGSGGFGPARDALRAARDGGIGPGSPAPSTAPGASARRFSSPRASGCRWRAGSPRSGSSTPSSRARCPRRGPG